jgi:cysteine synthase
LLVGCSSGTVVAAALRVARRTDISAPVVALLGDGWDRYRAQPWMQRLSAEAGFRS